jgi:hypothetical protein
VTPDASRPEEVSPRADHRYRFRADEHTRGGTTPALFTDPEPHQIHVGNDRYRRGPAAPSGQGSLDGGPAADVFSALPLSVQERQGDTAIEAATQARGSRTAAQRSEALEALVRCGKIGRTVDELCDELPHIGRDSISKRVGEIRDLELVVDTGARRLTRRNRPAIVWRCTTGSPVGDTAVSPVGDTATTVDLAGDELRPHEVATPTNARAALQEARAACAAAKAARTSR